MTPFDWLKGLQTGMAVSSLVLVMLCGVALAREIVRRPPGYAATLAIFLIALGGLLVNAWVAVQYWLIGIDAPITAPMSVRVAFNAIHLTGIAIFISQVQPPEVPRGPTFAIWSALVAMLVVMIALGG